MTINLRIPEAIGELKPRITVFGVGGAGGNAVNNMIQAGLEGVDFVVANTDSQALAMSSADRRIQMGTAITEGLGAGSQPQIGAAAAEEAMAEILDHIAGAHMVFITAGMGGGTGTGAAPVIARLARDQDILTIGVVTKPFQFEGVRRMKIAERGIEELEKHVDTLIVIPNQNLFRVANERTTFADAFAMADQVLYSGVAGVTDLMVKEGLINLDFADVRTIMNGMGKAMMGTGEACGEKRAIEAAEAAISNPLLDEVSMRGARGLLISITGGEDLTLYEVDEAATRIRSEVDSEANIILGATFDNTLEGYIRVSVVATGIDGQIGESADPAVGEDEIVERTGVTSTFGDFERARPRAAKLRPAAMPTAAAEQRRAQPLPADFEMPHQVAAEDHGHDGYRDAGFEPAGYPNDGVTIRRIDAHEGLGRRPAAQARDGEGIEAVPADDPSRPFIPPPAAAAPQDGPRMPRVEEFPVVGQRVLGARDSNPEPHGIEAQKRKSGFLERLANVGLGRREPAMRPLDDEEDLRLHEPTMPAPRVDPGAGHPLRRAEAAHFEPPVRPAPPPAQQGVLIEREDDDQLEIPAFLRRQAN